jgi:hypothetical protein
MSWKDYYRFKGFIKLPSIRKSLKITVKKGYTPSEDILKQIVYENFGYIPSHVEIVGRIAKLGYEEEEEEIYISWKEFESTTVPTKGEEIPSGTETDEETVYIDYGKTVTTGILKVHVDDYNTGRPISGAIVYVNSRAGTTNSSGDVSFELNEGSYIVRAYASGYYEESKSVSITAGKEESIVLSLKTPPAPKPSPAPLPASLTVYIVDSKTNYPIQGAVIYVDSLYQISDETGTAYFENLSEKEYIVRVYATDYKPESKTIKISSGEKASLIIKLTKLVEESPPSGTSTPTEQPAGQKTTTELSFKLSSERQVYTVGETIVLTSELGYETLINSSIIGFRPIEGAVVSLYEARSATEVSKLASDIAGKTYFSVTVNKSRVYVFYCMTKIDTRNIMSNAITIYVSEVPLTAEEAKVAYEREIMKEKLIYYATFIGMLLALGYWAWGYVRR